MPKTSPYDETRFPGYTPASASTPTPTSASEDNPLLNLRNGDKVTITNTKVTINGKEYTLTENSTTPVPWYSQDFKMRIGSTEVAARLFFYSPTRLSYNGIFISNPVKMVTTLEFRYEGRVATLQTTSAFMVGINSSDGLTTSSRRVWFMTNEGILAATGNLDVTESLVSSQSGWKNKLAYLLFNDSSLDVTLAKTPKYTSESLGDTYKSEEDKASVSFMRNKMAERPGISEMSDRSVEEEYTWKVQLIGAMTRLGVGNKDEALIFAKVFTDAERSEANALILRAQQDAEDQKNGTGRYAPKQPTSPAASSVNALIPPNPQVPLIPGQIPFRNSKPLPESGFRKYTPKLLLFTITGFALVAYMRWGPRAARAARETTSNPQKGLSATSSNPQRKVNMQPAVTQVAQDRLLGSVLSPQVSAAGML